MRDVEIKINRLPGEIYEVVFPLAQGGTGVAITLSRAAWLRFCVDLRKVMEGLEAQATGTEDA